MGDGLAYHADAMLGALQWEVNEMRITGPAVERNREKGPVFAAITASFRDVLRVFYCSFAYSALACFRIGMSGSASFQRVRKF